MTLLSLVTTHLPDCNLCAAFAGDAAHILERVARHLHGCGLSGGLYSTFGAYLGYHAMLLRRACRFEAAREQGLHGLVYLSLGLLH